MKYTKEYYDWNNSQDDILIKRDMISNEIFEHYRIKQREVAKAKNLLRLNGYSVNKNTEFNIDKTRGVACIDDTKI